MSTLQEQMSEVRVTWDFGLLVYCKIYTWHILIYIGKNTVDLEDATNPLNEFSLKRCGYTDLRLRR